MDKKKPTCGILSVTLRLVGLLVALGLSLAHGPDKHPLSAVEALILILSLLCPVSGIGFSIAGMFRRERFRWLPVFGLVLSTGTAVSYFIA